MKLLFDLFPVALFFGVFKWAESHKDAAHGLVLQYMGALLPGGGNPETSPAMLATVLCMAAALFQIAYLLVRRRKIDGMLWLTVVTIAVLGSLTVYFDNADFIKWKPTILYWSFALCLIVGHFVFKNNLMQQAMEAQMKLPEPIWAKVNLLWMGFFIVIGLLNLFVAFVLFKNNFSAWVNFKVFGITGIFFTFIIVQMLFLSKYILEEGEA